MLKMLAQTPNIKEPSKKWQYKLAHMYSAKVYQIGPLGMKDSASGKEIVHLKVDNSVVIGEDVFTTIDKLGSSGWELITVAPEVGPDSAGFAFLFAVDPVSHSTETKGYWLWFKRLIE